MDSATRCSNIIKQVNDHAHGGGLLTSDIGLENGATSRSFCFCMDRLWAWMKGVSYDKNEVAKSINTAFQGVDLSHLNVSKAELQIFSQNLDKLSKKFGKDSKFNQGLGGTISKVGLHVLIVKPTKQGLPLPKVIPPKTTVTTGHMDGASAARSNLRGPTLISSPPRHTSFPSVRTPLLSQPKAPVYVKGVEPTGLRGIPNYSDNCFLISTYQLVKSNPSLYDAIFNSREFKADKRFDALREFDRKYDSGTPLTRNDMELVRRNCLSKFGIPLRGHQDAEEVLTAALFQYVVPQNFMQSTSILEFVVPARSVDAVTRNMVEADLVSVKLRPDGQYNLRVRKQFKKDRAGNILNLPLRNISSRATFQQVFEAGFQKEGKTSLAAGSYHLDLASGAQISGGQQIERETVFSAGKSVTISFKRFEWQGYGNWGSSKKINTKVSIPNGQIQLDERGGPHVVKGFVVHRGRSPHGGHYVEYQKIGNQWYLNNDGSSDPVSTRDALLAMEDAYILQAEKA